MKKSLQLITSLLLIFLLLITCDKDDPIVQYSLSVEVTPTDGGTVTPDEGTYPDGTKISLLGTPSPEYIFKEWNGGVTGTTNPISVTMSSNKNITGVFEKRMYPLSLTIEGEGTVTEELISSKPNGDYPSGSVVKLTASPVDGWEFDSWSGDIESTENPIQVSMDKEKSITVKFIPRVYKNYLKTSYELSNYDEWLSSDDLYQNGNIFVNPLLPGPLEIQQTCQIDIDGDGDEDLYYYESYNLTSGLTPNPPPSVFINNGTILEKVEWNGPTLINPHGSKLLIGDFNNDSLPDIFSLVAIDLLENSVDQGKPQISHLLFNSQNGFNRVTEFVDQPGFHHTGCSGDIDNDGDLDVIMMNFGYDPDILTSKTSKILWNDGNGNFTYGTSGFSEIQVIHHSELYDVNNDGFLDLVISVVASHLKDTTDIIVMWGNGKDFELSNSTSFEIPVEYYLWNIDFIDVDNDGIAEIMLSFDDFSVSGGSNVKYLIELYKSDDNGLTFIRKTDQYFDNNTMSYVNRITVKDIDKNGKMDIYTSDKRDNIRWEWNGSMFLRVY